MSHIRAHKRGFLGMGGFGRPFSLRCAVEAPALDRAAFRIRSTYPLQHPATDATVEIDHGGLGDPAPL